MEEVFALALQYMQLTSRLYLYGTPRKGSFLECEARTLDHVNCSTAASTIKFRRESESQIPYDLPKSFRNWSLL
jgi:hypothetical protein